MSYSIAQMADRLLARLVPQAEAAAADQYWRYCYCKRGVAYRGLVYKRNGTWWFRGCEPSGTC